MFSGVCRDGGADAARGAAPGTAAVGADVAVGTATLPLGTGALALGTPTRTPLGGRRLALPL